MRTRLPIGVTPLEVTAGPEQFDPPIPAFSSTVRLSPEAQLKLSTQAALVIKAAPTTRALAKTINLSSLNLERTLKCEPPVLDVRRKMQLLNYLRLAGYSRS